MRIAVDGMGGDNAPQEVVLGAIQAAQAYGFSVLLVGREEQLRAELAKQDLAGLDIEVVDAPEVIEMGEHPATALRRKRNASIAVATRLVAEGKADAVVSAGNTGAAMAAALLQLGRIPGVERPAISTLMPTVSGSCIILDVGANVDCSPHNLVQFAQMGSIYAQKVLGRAQPRLGLLSIGEEPAKGNDLVRAVHAQLLEHKELNFIGNIEGRDIPLGNADVVVCDGFVGNVVIKLVEGLAHGAGQLVRQVVKRSLLAKLGLLFLWPSFKQVGKRLDYAEYGGAPLLGVNGVAIISHGRSNARAIQNAIRVAGECVQNRMIAVLKEQIGKTKEEA